MSKKRKESPGFTDWKFGGKIRSEARVDQVAKRVSEVIKGYGPRTYHRYDPAMKFARKMRAAAARLRGDRRRDVIDAICMGVGSGHRWAMIRRYEAAAKAAERFCTTRSR